MNKLWSQRKCRQLSLHGIVKVLCNRTFLHTRELKMARDFVARLKFDSSDPLHHGQEDALPYVSVLWLLVLHQRAKNIRTTPHCMQIFVNGK